VSPENAEIHEGNPDIIVIEMQNLKSMKEKQPDDFN
jgi:hypothetical protein